MLDRALDRFVSIVTRHRKVVIAFVLAVAAVCASQLPRLELDSAAEALMISRAGYAAEMREFREQFGDTDGVVLLLVGASDVTSRPALEHVHTLSRHFAQ